MYSVYCVNSQRHVALIVGSFKCNLASDTARQSPLKLRTEGKELFNSTVDRCSPLFESITEYAKFDVAVVTADEVIRHFSAPSDDYN